MSGWVTKRNIIGIIKIHWAIIIAVGVYNKPKKPSGPDLDKYKYTIYAPNEIPYKCIEGNF